MIDNQWLLFKRNKSISMYIISKAKKGILMRPLGVVANGGSRRRGCLSDRRWPGAFAGPLRRERQSGWRPSRSFSDSRR